MTVHHLSRHEMTVHHLSRHEMTVHYLSRHEMTVHHLSRHEVWFLDLSVLLSCRAAVCVPRGEIQDHLSRNNPWLFLFCCCCCCFELLSAFVYEDLNYVQAPFNESSYGFLKIT